MALEVKNLVKKYGDKVVVNNLSFKMEEPGVYALLGTNGAGKTTTIRIILGMLSYNEGEVLWDGKPMDALNVNLGYLAEERGLYPKYSLMDQLLYFASLKRIPKNVAKERIKYWAKRLEVEEYIYPAKSVAKGKKKPKDKTADQLSKGNQQKIQMMCALLSDPDFVVLDEPLSGLDPVNSDLFKTPSEPAVPSAFWVSNILNNWIKALLFPRSLFFSSLRFCKSICLPLFDCSHTLSNAILLYFLFFMYYGIFLKNFNII